MISTLTQKGQTTIPKEIREFLGLKINDRLEFIIDHGVVELKPLSSIEANFGRVKSKNKPEQFSKIRDKFTMSVAKEQIK